MVVWVVDHRVPHQHNLQVVVAVVLAAWVVMRHPAVVLAL
jgi:hypothetical protein